MVGPYRGDVSDRTRGSARGRTLSHREPLSDGKSIWISGEFEIVAPPHKLVYTWRLDPGPPRTERVTVTFDPHGHGTEVVVIHERIPGKAERERHERGWQGCLEGLAEYVQRAR